MVFFVSKLPKDASVAVLLTASLISFLAAFDVTALNVALANIRAEFQIGIDLLQWIIGAYTLTFACLLLAAGTLSDWFGAKKILIIALILFCTSSVACGLSTNIVWLILARILQGCGAALMLPSSMAFLAIGYPDVLQRAKAMAIWGGVSAIALVVGPLVGGVVIELFGWRYIFYINIAPCFIAAISIANVLYPVTRQRKNFDWRGQILSLIVFSCVTFSLIEAPSVGWLNYKTLFLLTIGSLVFIFFVKLQIKNPDSMIPTWLFKSKVFSASLGTGLLQTMAYYGCLFLLPLTLQTNGSSPINVGILMSPMTISTGLTALLSGRLVKLVGARTVGFFGLLGGAVGTLLLIAFGFGVPNIIFGGILLGIGGGTLPIIITACMSSLPTTKIGVGTGIFNVSRQLGGLFGISLIGSIIRTTNNTLFALFIIATSFLISAILMRRYLHQD